MTTYVQETDYRTVNPAPPEFLYSTTRLVPDETFGGYPAVDYLAVPLDSDILGAAWEFAHRLGGGIGTQAKFLLSILQAIFSTMQRPPLDPGCLPKLQSHLDEDGSVLFEWILPNFRIGFSIEPDPSQSGWFLATDEELGSITGSGYVSDVNLPRLAWFLISFLVSHS